MIYDLKYPKNDTVVCTSGKLIVSRHIHSRVNNNGCSFIYTHAVGKGLRGQKVLNQLLLILLCICS